MKTPPLNSIEYEKQRSITTCKAGFKKTLSLLPIVLVCITISACRSLPDVPHTADSVALTERAQLLYPITIEPSHNNETEFSRSELDNTTSINNNTNSNNINSNSTNGVNTGADIASDTINIGTELVSETDLINAINSNDSSNNNGETITPNVTSASLTDLTSQISASNTGNYTSAYYPILNGAEAFTTRSMLTGMSDKSIDVQYYIWHNDETGQLLLKDLWLAAERGVIVRLLLDDFNNDAEFDVHLRKFASHPRIAVRLVNPFAHRKFQAIDMVTDIRRLNHRMHNKSMTFDRQLTIIGGRNVGDEYFSNSQGSQFADLDVLLAGDVVSDVQDSFETYWNSDMSYDIETLVDSGYEWVTQPSHSGPEATERFLSTLARLNTDNPNNLSHLLAFNRDSYQNTVTPDPEFVLNLPYRWASMQFLTDDVSKLSNNAMPNSHLVHQLREILGKPDRQLTIISSYFVPTPDGAETLIELAQQGVEINILTNSYDATDVAAVQSGYDEWRRPFLQAGIKLYELKAVSVNEESQNRLWRPNSESSTSLHAKAFAVDSPQVFIGSYNIDPRSANINTELGVVINDDVLSRQLHDAVTPEVLLELAYEVLLTDAGTLQWRTMEEEGIVVYDTEPKVDLSDTLWVRFLSWLPIDWLL